MPGFLEASGYDGTERIDLGNGYWADVKKCLSSAEASLAEAAMMTNHRLGDRGQAADLNSRGYRTELVVLSLAGWNIDEQDGTVWPLDPGQPKAGAPVPRNPYLPGCPRRQSVARLPEPVFELIWQKCDELNSPRTGPDAASFPDGAVGGDPYGDGGPAGPAAVPVRTGAVAELRADERDGWEPPAP
jgi:hypothetical protein